nr:uncharacterized protein LOC107419123 isoform X2 [Ziziphus jujuba var. spinosa]XP_048329297.1 uncharacterized protein LOC107419123 isoform X2 [Ziziphus jujuba var. spinosa]XP_048329298.1 uncharacterized protein LOC107419123 isoform X2 [Ziziphus jujuba var. spinosa]XP_048329299.1 uncharacterized protein LOC107419123 isoform X2 [Ziziphus jujuba var. spinosa]
MERLPGKKIYKNSAKGMFVLWLLGDMDSLAFVKICYCRRKREANTDVSMHGWETEGVLTCFYYWEDSDVMGNKIVACQRYSKRLNEKQIVMQGNKTEFDTAHHNAYRKHHYVGEVALKSVKSLLGLKRCLCAPWFPLHIMLMLLPFQAYFYWS